MLTIHEPLARYVKLWVAHTPGMPGTFSPPPRFSDPDMPHGTCVTHVPWCMPGSLTSGFLWSRWRGKRSRYSWRMRNPQFCLSGKRPIVSLMSGPCFTCTITVQWWRHQMETFSALLILCAGNLPVTSEFPSQRPVTRALLFSMICVWINGWVNNREAGDLRRHDTHYDAVVMVEWTILL